MPKRSKETLSFAKISVGKLSQEWAESCLLPNQHLAETDSTNRAAKDLVVALDIPRLLVLADHQTHGRGRAQNTWTDEDQGQQLLSSWLFNKPNKFQHTTGQLFGLALYHAASTTYPQLQWSLKAPNDLYLNHLKVAGLLIEIVSGGPSEQVIVGLGLNVHSHPQAIDNATHLLHHDPNALERWFQFLNHVLAQFTWAAAEALKPELSDLVRNQLLQALNRYPRLTEPYTAVDAQGNLSTLSRHIRWTEL